MIIFRKGDEAGKMEGGEQEEEREIEKCNYTFHSYFVFKLTSR